MYRSPALGSPLGRDIAARVDAVSSKTMCTVSNSHCLPSARACGATQAADECLVGAAMQGSMASIENRGHLERERDANGTVPWDADTVSASMKRVRYTDYDHLSDDQIEKARKRRLRERDVSSPSLEVRPLPLPSATITLHLSREQGAPPCPGSRKSGLPLLPAQRHLKLLCPTGHPQGHPELRSCRRSQQVSEFAAGRPS